MTVVEANIAHGENETALLVSTREIGQMALAFDPSVGKNIKFEIDRMEAIEAGHFANAAFIGMI